MFNFIFKKETDGKYKAIARIVYDGKVYGTRVIVNDNRAETVKDAFDVLYDEMEDTIEFLNEQKNEVPGDPA